MRQLPRKPLPTAAPDGIIVNAIDNADMEEAVNSAAQQNIPVICVGTDIYGSKRSSYVGISYYTLGQAYAQCILPLQKDAQQRVLVIKSPEEHTTGQALILSGLQDGRGQQELFHRRGGGGPLCGRGSA